MLPPPVDRKWRCDSSVWLAAGHIQPCDITFGTDACPPLDSRRVPPLHDNYTILAAKGEQPPPSPLAAQSGSHPQDPNRRFHTPGRIGSQAS